MKKLKRRVLKKSICMLLCVSLFLGGILLGSPQYVAYAAVSGLSVTSKYMLVKESYQLKLTGVSAKTATWSSSDTSVCKVSNGKVTARKAGKAVISARLKGKTYTCRIVVRDTVDLIVFAGQSNMMGHGDAAKAPDLIEGAAYEYKSVTDKNSLSDLKEPFGYKQDSGNLVNGQYCTGSMVTAFCNAYYNETGTPIVAVAASKLGSGSVGWSTVYYKDVEQRIKQSVKAVKKMGLKIDHCYLVWMQGENDVCAGTSTKQYVKRIGGMLKKITKDTAVEKCMLIQTGKLVYNMGAGDLADPEPILAAQLQICEKYDQVILISSKAAKVGQRYYQADLLHFNQKGLNAIGKDAGKNAGKYTNTLK
jgi:hypothetical protein